MRYKEPATPSESLKHLLGLNLAESTRCPGDDDDPLEHVTDAWKMYWVAFGILEHLAIFEQEYGPDEWGCLSHARMHLNHALGELRRHAERLGPEPL